MNAFHRWYCRSPRWAARLQGEVLPAMVTEDLGEHALEIGPGPGVATEWLRTRVPRLTSIEIDHALAESLKHRMAGANVTVVEGDASAMPFPDNEFTAALCFTMLHHVPYRLQDLLLREACRVLRPGAFLIGMDSTPNLRWNLYHLFDDRNPIDPATFAPRLEAAGFTAAAVRVVGSGFSFRARKP